MRYAVIFVFITQIVFSQANLVPNGDFESYSICPISQGQITLCDNWFQPYIPASSSDYFNSCSSTFGVPFNDIGYQSANSGYGYSGIQCFSGSFNVREYLEVKLLDTLSSNITYCLRMYVNVPDSVDTFVDGIAGFFSDDSVLYSNPFFGVLNLPAQVQNASGNIITDTANWILIEGEFVASGGEQFLTIGNFKTDIQTQTIPAILPPGANNSYFYIDDVSVTEGSCNVSIDETSNSNFKINISPNPAKDHFQITVPEKNFSNLKYQVYAVDGRRIQDGVFQRNAAIVQCAEWESGLYLVQVFDQDGNTSAVKVLKL